MAVQTYIEKKARKAVAVQFDGTNESDIRAFVGPNIEVLPWANGLVLNLNSTGDPRYVILIGGMYVFKINDNPAIFVESKNNFEGGYALV